MLRYTTIQVVVIISAPAVALNQTLVLHAICIGPFGNRSRPSFCPLPSDFMEVYFSLHSFSSGLVEQRPNVYTSMVLILGTARMRPYCEISVTLFNCRGPTLLQWYAIVFICCFFALVHFSQFLTRFLVPQGYGLIYPATSVLHKNQGQCASVMFLCSVEAFIGVLFGSFCGAIMFGKVARVRSIAQVEFSDALVVRYGRGVLVEDSDMADDRSAKSASDSSTNASCNLLELPCPVLEFRIANQMYAITGGEIMDCTLNIVASIDGSRAESLMRSRSKRRRRRKGKAVGRRIEQSIGDDSYRQNPMSEPEKNKLKHLASRVVEQANRSELPFEEDPFGKIASKRLFSKLEVETPDHPFFKRVWTIRHTLDCESPILADDAKQAIRLNNGFWPREFNDPLCVRACLNFDQILVSFSGTSNADANSVYAQKVYDFESVSVGYVFVNMMYVDGDHSSGVQVDLAVINDVTEQAGGGGEDLNANRHPSNSDMYVL